MNYKIKNTNLFFLICVPIIGLSVFDIATRCAEFASTSAWAHLITALIFIIPILIVYIYIQSFSDCNSAFDLSETLFGEFISKLFMIIYTVFFIVIGGLYVYYYSSTLTDWLNSPIDEYLISALLTIISALCAKNGIKSIIRIFSFLGFLSLFTLIIVRIIMLFKGDYLNLLPIFEINVYKENFKSIFTEIIPCFFPVGIILFLPLDRNDLKTNLISGIFGVVVSVLIMILVTTVCYALIGVDGTAENQNALVISMQLFDTKSIEFISRFDLLFIITWINFILMTLSLFFYIPIQGYFHLNKNGENISIPCIAIAVLWFIISLFPDTNAIAADSINLTLYILGSICFIVIPLIMLFGVIIKKCIKR